MSKYTRLTTTEGLQIGDSVYLPTHSGKKEMVVVGVNHEQSTVSAVFREIYDKGQKNPEVQQVIDSLFSGNFTTVTMYYKKHVPKTRAPRPAVSNEPAPEEPKITRTPDMYEFD